MATKTNKHAQHFSRGPHLAAFWTGLVSTVIVTVQAVIASAH